MYREYIDTHVHVGDKNHLDGSLNRQFMVEELNQLGLISVGKAHFLPYVPEDMNVHGSLTLNNGFSPTLIEHTAKKMNKPWIVWGPTINAQAHQDAVQKDEAWKTLFQGVVLNKPINILTEDSGELKAEVCGTLHAIKEANAILATGHLSPNEAEKLVSYAITIGIQKIILTHVSSRHNRMTIEQQKKLIHEGLRKRVEVYAEHCAITWFDGKEGSYDLFRDFVFPIQQVGSEHCILSSDCGRTLPSSSSKPLTPRECLHRFADLLIEHGLTENDIYQMTNTNPKKLLGYLR